jgi:hypothetical protein
MNINKLLKDFPRILERLEALERKVSITLEPDTIRAMAASLSPRDVSVTIYPTTAVDTGTQVPVTLAPAVSEHSPAVTRGAGIGEKETRNRRGSTRRN